MVHLQAKIKGGAQRENKNTNNKYKKNNQLLKINQVSNYCKHNYKNN